MTPGFVVSTWYQADMAQTLLLVFLRPGLYELRRVPGEIQYTPRQVPA